MWNLMEESNISSNEVFEIPIGEERHQWMNKTTTINQKECRPVLLSFLIKNSKIRIGIKISKPEISKNYDQQTCPYSSISTLPAATWALKSASGVNMPNGFPPDRLW